METSKWINTVLNELSKLDGNNGFELMSSCGKECSKGSRLLEGAIEISNQYKNDTDPDKLFDAYKVKYYNTTRMMKDGNQITLIFDDCPCYLVKAGITNPYLCNCTIGYTRTIFETLFTRPIHVELVQSILRGDKICKQIIRID